MGVLKTIICSMAMTMLISNQVIAEGASRAQLEAYTVSIGNEYNICPELIQAIIQTESNWDAEAENGGCCGLMQIAPKWHRERMERLNCNDIYNPYQNILVGVDYLSELAKEDIDISLALDRYNGNSKADEYARTGELSPYAEKVLTLSEKLERQNGK